MTIDSLRRLIATSIRPERSAAVGPRESAMMQTNGNGTSPSVGHNVSRAPQGKSMRARLAQIFDTNHVPDPPSIRFDVEWEQAAAQVCTTWVETQATHNASHVSCVALSRMKALEYERKNLQDIPETDRLLPPTANKKDYYDAEVDAFLEAINVEDAASVLDSFARGGTGGLHRQHATIGATVSNALGAAIVFAHDPVAKAALSGARLATQLVTQKTVLDSGNRRLRNACAQDVLPHGRPDTAPAGKAAPNVLSASCAVLRELPGAEKNMHKLQLAVRALSDAHAAEPNDIEAIGKAKQAVEFAFAKLCHQISIKSAYKAASENAKIEFRGNLRYLLASYTGTSTTMATGLLAIMTPMVMAAPVTGGLSAAAVALALGLYVGYQMSSGPAEDGKAKGRRAIVALAKLVVVLSGEDTSNIAKRANAFRDYRRDKAAVKVALPGRKATVRTEAKATLLARLDDITREAAIESRLTLRGNWQGYRAYATNIKANDTAMAQGLRSHADGERYATELKEEFVAANGGHLASNDLLDAWKTPMRIRMEAASRLVKGKVARSHKKVLALLLQPSLKARFGTPHQKTNNNLLIEETRTELRKNLLNMFNFELALHGLKRKEGNDACSADILVAIERMSAVDDDEVRNLFCGDGRAQVDAVNMSKKLTAGEAERYTYANAGSAALSITANLAVATADVAVNGAKGDGTYGGPQFNDYKFAAVSQAGAQPGAHLSAGDRAAFQAREMRALISVTDNPANEEVVIALAGDANRVLRIEDEDVMQKLDMLVADLEKAPRIPEKIRLSIQRHAPEAASSSSGNQASNIEIAVDLTTTAALRRVQYKHAPVGEKIRHSSKQLAIGGRQAAMSLLGLPAQGIAQLILRKTREPLNHATTLARSFGSVSDAENGENAEDIFALLKRSEDALAAPAPADEHFVGSRRGAER